MAPKNADTCRRAITISKQHAPSSKAGSAAGSPGNKLRTLLATEIVCTVAFAHVSILKALRTETCWGAV